MPASFEPGLLAWAAEVVDGDEQLEITPLSPTPSSPYACSVDFRRLTADLETGVLSPSTDSHQLPGLVTSPSSAALSDNFNKDLPTIPRASIA